MKRTLHCGRVLTLLALCLLIGLSAVPALAVGQSTTLANSGDRYYTTTALNYRSSPANLGASNRIGTFPGGTAVTYQRNQNGWWYVTSSRGNGWVDKQYLTPTAQASTGTYYVSASALNVRSAPKMGAAIVGTLSRGTAVSVSHLNGDWCQIGANRWVATRYLSHSYSGSSSSSSSSSRTSTSVSAGTSYRVNIRSGYLNIRASASSSSASVGRLSANQSVYIDATSGNWAHVKGRGWVYKPYLK